MKTIYHRECNSFLWFLQILNIKEKHFPYLFLKEFHICTYHNQIKPKNIYQHMHSNLLLWGWGWGCWCFQNNTYLINQLSPILVLFIKNFGPKIQVPALHQVSWLTLEQGVLIAHLKKKNWDRLGKTFGKIIFIIYKSLELRTQGHLNLWNYDHLET